MLIKVFHFILDHRIGGPHVYAKSIAKMLGAHVQSTLATTGKGDATELALTNLRHRFRALYPFEVVLNAFRLCWLFKDKHSRSACIFDVHGAANIAPLIAARLLGIPVVWHFHETLGSFRGLVWFGRTILAGSAHKLVVVAKKSVKIFGIIDAEVIPGAIDADFWKVTTSEGEARQQERPLRLAAVGNLNPLKGIDLLLDALVGLEQQWELVVVGADLSTFHEYAAMLREKGRNLARGTSKVQFSGWQPPESVRRLLASADVFVLPSRSEACPIALLEAMAMGCVCVATDVGDVRQIMNGPGLGIVVKSESVEQLRMALKQVCSMDPVARSEMGARARKRVVVQYSQNLMAERHFEIYRALVREQMRS